LAKLLFVSINPKLKCPHFFQVEMPLVVYALVGGNIYLLTIKHQRQLSFDFEAHWGAPSSMP
jgi:hypothetical protein